MSARRSYSWDARKGNLLIKVETVEPINSSLYQSIIMFNDNLGQGFKTVIPHARQSNLLSLLLESYLWYCKPIANKTPMNNLSLTSEAAAYISNKGGHVLIYPTSVSG